jgi:hypothetical protein
MTFKEIQKKIGFRGDAGFEPAQWKASQALFPVSTPFFLTDRFIREELKLLRLSPARHRLFLDAARLVRANPALARLAWHGHYLIFLSRKEVFPDGDKWIAALRKAMGKLAGGFPGLALFGGLPKLMAFYRTKGISPRILEDTVSDVRIWMDDYEARHQGALGLARLNWLPYHFKGRLFRLGRLQFMRKKMGPEVRAYRNRSGDWLMLATPILKFNVFNRDGQVEWAKKDAPGNWKASFRDRGAFVEGHPITHSGRALRETVRLDKKQWKQVLGPGDSVLDVHIAAGQPMDDPGCLRSYRQARKFFPKYFGGTYKAIVCWSWLFEPRFQDILPPGSNIVRFQNRYHRYPVASGDGEIFNRIFGGRPKKLDQAPRDTRIRRAILDFYESGQTFTGGAAGILKEPIH